MASVVSIEIAITDNGSTAVIGNAEKSLVSLGDKGTASLNKLGSAAADASSSLAQTGAATAATEENVDKLTATVDKAIASYNGMAAAAEGATKRSATAGAEMQQMLDNIARAQKSHNAFPTNRWQGPSNQLGDSFENLGTAKGELQQLGDAFAAMPKRIKSASDEAGRFGQSVGSHTTTALDKVRLLSQEFGLRLPRALESMLSRMPAFTAAISGLTTGMVAFAGAEIFAHLGTEVYDLEQRFISIQAPVDKFYETLKKATELDFSNTKSLETTGERLAMSERGSKAAGELAQSQQSVGLMDLILNPVQGISELIGAHDAAESQATNMGRTQELTKRQLDQTHALALAQIELNHAKDGELQGIAKINASLAKQKEINKENQLYTFHSEGGQGNPAPRSAGMQEKETKDATAQAEAAAETSVLLRKERDERIAAQNAAIDAGLEGEARYTAQREQAIDAVTRKYQDGELTMAGYRAIRAATEEKFDNEAAERQQKQIDEAQKMLRDSGSAGLKGADKVRADHDARVSDINTNRTLDPQAASLQRQAAAQEETNRLADLDEQFTEHAKQLARERTDATLGGFAKIESAAQRQHDALQKEYDNAYGKTGGNASQAKAKADADAAIDAAATEEKQQLAAKNRAEDLQYAREASQAEARVRQSGIAGWVADYKNGIAEIRAQEDQRMAKLAEDAQKEGLTAEEVAQRKQDIAATANAQIAEQNQNLQNTISSQLQQAFMNPTDFIKQHFQKMIFDMLANAVTQMSGFQKLFGSTMTGAAPSGGGFLQSLGLGRPSGTAGVIQRGTSLPGAAGGSSSSTTELPTQVLGQSFSFQPQQQAESYEPGMTGTGRTSSYSSADTAASLISKGGSFAGQIANWMKPKSPSEETGNTASGVDDTTANEGSDNADQDGMNGVVGGGVPASSALSTAAGLAADGYAAYSGARGVISDFTKGGLSGALDSTMSGAEAGAAIGTMFAPGIGTAIGAGIGAAVGLATNAVGQALGMGPRDAARDYYKSTLFPQMDGILHTFSASGGDYLSAISQENAAYATGVRYMQTKWGMDAAGYVKANYLDKELQYATQGIRNAAGGGAGYMTRSTAEFHNGGIFTDPMDMRTSSTTGLAHLNIGEGIINTDAMQMHRAAVPMMNSGASAAEMAAHYLAASGASRGGGNVTNHYHQHDYSMLDGKSFEQFLDGGGITAVNRSASKRAQIYGGDGLE